jgi:hypothetical protein
LTLDPPTASSDEAGVPLLDEDYLILSTIHLAVIDHGGDAVDTAEPLVKAGRILSSHWHLLDVDSLSVFRW